MVTGLTSMVNLAAADIDGDRIPEVAIQNEFSMIAAKSPGVVARRNGVHAIVYTGDTIWKR
jgi:hypothetical protein